MAFHNIRFPLDISIGARGGPQRLTDIVTLASGAEERNSRWMHSRRRYDAGYGVKSRADMRNVLDFFEGGAGASMRFYGAMPWTIHRQTEEAAFPKMISPWG